MVIGSCVLPSWESLDRGPTVDSRAWLRLIARAEAHLAPSSAPVLYLGLQRVALRTAAGKPLRLLEDHLEVRAVRAGTSAELRGRIGAQQFLYFAARPEQTRATPD